MTGAARCPVAIHFGVTLHTRCFKAPGHNDAHEGRGLPLYPYQRITWYPGDRRAYTTSRTERHAWEQDNPDA